MSFTIIRVRVERSACILALHRPEADNAINATMVAECRDALKQNAYGDDVHIVVLEGSPDVFCLGADFDAHAAPERAGVDPAALYDLWSELARGPFISIAHVRGKAAGGGVGFAAACDIVLADRTAEFALPELLFSLYPACVLPFLIRRIGLQKAHYMTLTTKPVAAEQALEWGLVDDYGGDSADLLRKHLLRLRHLPKDGIRRYKAYANGLDEALMRSREAAVAANRALFSDPKILETLRRFAETKLFPWEK